MKTKGPLPFIGLGLYLLIILMDKNQEGLMIKLMIALGIFGIIVYVRRKK